MLSVAVQYGCYGHPAHAGFAWVQHSVSRLCMCHWGGGDSQILVLLEQTPETEVGPCGHDWPLPGG